MFINFRYCPGGVEDKVVAEPEHHKKVLALIRKLLKVIKNPNG
jgi:hypothetical protein